MSKRRDYSYTGQARRMYNQQRRNAIKRGHPLPTYSCKEFITWCISNPVYIRIHDNWKASGCKTRYVPSADRIDDSKSYILSNLQIMTWEENRLKKIRERQENGTLGQSDRVDVRVSQYTKTGEYLATYASARDAAKAINKKARANIIHACRGRAQTAYGYRWKYTV